MAEDKIEDKAALAICSSVSGKGNTGEGEIFVKMFSIAWFDAARASEYAARASSSVLFMDEAVVLGTLFGSLLAVPSLLFGYAIVSKAGRQA